MVLNVHHLSVDVCGDAEEGIVFIEVIVGDPCVFRKMSLAIG